MKVPVIAGQLIYLGLTPAVIIALFGLVRLYLAVDHPDDVLFGVALGVGASPVKSLVRTPGRCRATMRRGLIWREAGGTPSG